MNSTQEIKIVELLETVDSGDWFLAREAVEQAGAVLRQGGLDASSHAQIGKRLVGYAKNYKWEVRKALAHAVLYLRHESFEHIMAVLDQDDHALVRNAAKRTMSRRSEISKSDLLKDQHGDLMLRWLEDLEVKHGVMARNAARRVSEKLQAQYVKELDHELIKVISPLKQVLGNIEIAIQEKRIDREELERKVQKAGERVDLLCSVLNSLRAMSQAVDLEFQTEGLMSVVEEAVHLVRDRKEENASLEVDLKIDPDIAVEANRHLLLQALTNILQNSVEAYAGSNRIPSVTVTASLYNGTRVQIAFVDNGCGMSERGTKDALQLFATSKPQGTGFGLKIAKKIIESDHNGKVYLESVKGKGTTVTIMLPKEQELRGW